MKKALLTILIKLKLKIKIIIKILFSSKTILEQSINTSTIIIIASEKENPELINFLGDTDNINKALNTYIKKKHNMQNRAKTRKNKITINVNRVTK